MKQKIMCFIIIATCCYASTGIAQPVGWIGLFADDSHNSWCVAGEGFYPVEMWVWSYPSANGQMAAEYGIAYPANVIRSTITVNEAIVSNVFGDLPQGVTVWYSECQYGWTWNIHQLIYVTDATKTYCEIVPHADTGSYQLASCLEGNPFGPCYLITHLYLNYESNEPECTS